VSSPGGGHSTLAIAGNHSANTGNPATGLVLEAPAAHTAPGTVIVDGCIIVNNDLAVSDQSSAVGTSAAPIRKIVNNLGYNPVISGSWSPDITGAQFNNTGVDQMVYVKAPGTSGTVTITVGSEAVSGLGAIPGDFFVPNGAGIQVVIGPTSGTAPVWEWLGN
jgi:hypothetical protein